MHKKPSPAAVRAADIINSNQTYEEYVDWLRKSNAELVATLRNLHDACEFWEDQNDPVLADARKAIAKATRKKPSVPAMRVAAAIINSGSPATNSVTVHRVAEVVDRETSLSTLQQAMKTLMEKADGLISAIDGTTGQFEPEVAALSAATSAAEKVLDEIKEAKHGKSR